MSEIKLGKLEKVDLRDIWASESSDFTPWLATDDNIAALGEVIGMDLEVQAQEKQVGPFRADILCQNINSPNEEWVLIENQLERTDHCHLGQIITYAAGLDAATIVWVAQNFTEEHRAAIDWLNEITQEKFRFFGLEIELWRIGTSIAAPKFNIVCKPNDWSKTVRTVAHDELSEAKQIQQEFWQKFVDLLGEKNFAQTRIPMPKPYHALEFGIGRSGFWIATVASNYDSEIYKFEGLLRVELVVTGNNSKQYFQLLKEHKDKLEATLGEVVTFYERENVQMCRVYVRKPVELSDRSHWDQYAQWLYERLVKFHDFFRPIVRGLKLETQELSATVQNGDE